MYSHFFYHIINNLDLNLKNTQNYLFSHFKDLSRKLFLRAFLMPDSNFALKIIQEHINTYIISEIF